MSAATIACIVEGHGEVSAVPILVRRIVGELSPACSLRIPGAPIRVGRATIVKPGEIERAVELAARSVDRTGAILILLDADDDCPARLAPDLLQRARQQRSDIPIALVLACREFEAWFLASAASLAGRQGLLAEVQPPDWPEDIRGAKEWLRQHMEPGRKYSETVDQPELTRHLDLLAARKAPSFDKLWRAVQDLLCALGCEICDA